MRNRYWLPWEVCGSRDEHGRECINYLAGRIAHMTHGSIDNIKECIYRLIGLMCQKGQR